MHTMVGSSRLLHLAVRPHHTGSSLQCRILDQRYFRRPIHRERTVGTYGHKVIGTDISLIVNITALGGNRSVRKILCVNRSPDITDPRDGKQARPAAHRCPDNAGRGGKGFIGQILVNPLHHRPPQGLGYTDLIV